MRKIVTIGETVFDIIFKQGQPYSSKAGGAMLNSSVTLGRLSLPVSFITEIGDDQVGQTILEFLNENNVNTGHVSRFRDGKTALALAFLNRDEDAEYTFYKHYPEKRLLIDLPGMDENDILLFGSFFAITKAVRSPLVNLLRNANQKKSIILYDPNFRRPHIKDLPEVKDMILENILFSTIVRGSDDDFQLIFGAHSADDAYKIIKEQGCNFLIYTRNGKGVDFRSDKLSFTMDVPPVRAVSTIGAGDNFNAGLMYCIFRENISCEQLKNMDETFWNETIRVAISFGSHVCQHYDNYISVDFAEQFKMR